jgi:hypothetical protein
LTFRAVSDIWGRFCASQEKKGQLKRLEDLNRDIDIFINDFLKVRTLSHRKFLQGRVAKFNCGTNPSTCP